MPGSCPHEDTPEGVYCDKCFTPEEIEKMQAETRALMAGAPFSLSFTRARTRLTGGLRTGCYCTGECKTNPCHPCNSSQRGWVCPRCGLSNAPWVSQCSCQRPSPPTYPSAPLRPNCGCPPYGICMNAACPRRVRITCSSSTDPNGSLARWEGEGGAWRDPGVPE